MTSSRANKNWLGNLELEKATHSKDPLTKKRAILAYSFRKIAK